MFIRRRAVVLVLVGMAIAALGVTGAVSAAGGVSYVRRVGTASVTLASSTATVKTSAAVNSGDTLIVSVMLGGLPLVGTPGSVSASDSAGNTYAIDRDQSDSNGNRLVVLSAINVKPLASGATVQVTYPLATTAFVTVDEFTGIGSVAATSSEFGPSGTFNSGPAPAVPGQILYGVVGVLNKQNPTWNSGWSALGNTGNGSRRLAPAYQAPASAGSYSASGKTKGSWLAAVVSFSPPEVPPVAKLSVSPASGTAPLSVTANASGSTDTDLTPISTYKFDFGDGTVVGPQAGASAPHTYQTTGTFTVTVTVTDTAGLSSSTTATVTATDAPPAANLSVTPSSGTVPLAVTADASASTDKDLTPIQTYTFDFGDGTVVGPQPGASASHTYANTGTYTVTVTVTDTGGQASSATSTVTVNPDQAPVAKLTVTPPSGVPPLTVNADASASTDTDSTPISTYKFDFGDGTVVGPQPGASASHTYANTGTYTVTVSVTDTAGLSSTTTATVLVSSDQPPVAKLNVTPSSGAAPLAVTADASTSTDTDSTPISTYKFDFGDGTVVGPQAGATASHSYSSAGTFTVTVTVTDTAGMSSTATATVNVVAAQVNVYAGYYDTHHASTNPKPNPWSGSPNVVFQGTPDTSSGGWDTSAVRIDNLSGASLPFVSFTVDIGTHHYALWNTTSLSSGWTLVAAQTAFENFDGSDDNPAGCYGCSADTCTTEVQSTIPVVHVTVDGVTTNYPDPKQILNTHGVDSAGCPYTGTRNDESESWQQLAAASP
jgi:PKD repeat protein